MVRAVTTPGALRFPGLRITVATACDDSRDSDRSIAALHTPRPPPLMVLDEPETSLHPDLLPAVARLIAQAARRTQVWVVSHATRFVAALEAGRTATASCSTNR